MQAWLLCPIWNNSIYVGYSSFIWLYACAHMDDCEKSALDKNEWQFYNSLHFNLARCFPHFRRFVVRIFSTFATTVLNVQSFVCTQSNTHTHTHTQAHLHFHLNVLLPRSMNAKCSAETWLRPVTIFQSHFWMDKSNRFVYTKTIWIAFFQ